MTPPRLVLDKEPLFASLLPQDHKPQQRRPARAPLPTTRQLSEQRRQRFFRRIDDERQSKQFERRADDMMYSTYLRQQEEWESQMARAAEQIPEAFPEDETDTSDAMQLSQDVACQTSRSDVPPELEYGEDPDASDFDTIKTPPEHVPMEETDDTGEEHFGSDDDTEEFRTLLYQVVEQCERARLPQQSSQSESMDMT